MLLVKLINYTIIAVMGKIIIDTDKWTTQQDKANNWIGKSGKPVSVQYISKLIKKGKLKSYPIPEINLVLVERQ